MNWYAGNIAEAVAESKATDAIFVVYIEGQDEMSAKLQRFVDDESVRSKMQTSDFVAIKIRGDSESYNQFRSLYKVVPVPSIFFIGKSGTPLEIATGIIASAEELTAKIDRVLVVAGKRAPTQAQLEAVDAASLTSASAEALAIVSNVVERSVAGADPSGSQTDASQKRQADGGEAPPMPMPMPSQLTAAAEVADKAADKTTTEEADKFKPIEVAADNEKPEDKPVMPAADKPGTSLTDKASTDKAATDKPDADITAADKPATVETATIKDQPFVVVASDKAAEDKPAADKISISPMADAAEKRAALNNAVSAAATTTPTTTPISAPAEEPQASSRSPILPTTIPTLVLGPSPAPIAPAAVNPSRPAAPPGAPTPNRPLTDSEMRVVEVQNILEEKKRERQEEEQKREKENELRRRRESREAQNSQSWQKEQELKHLQERIRRERQEEHETRERIRAQIAADRAEQARRHLLVAADLANLNTSAALAPITPDSSMSSVDETRLQIRLPGGIHRTKAFPAAEPLSTVRNYVRNELLAGSNVREFTLATSYPRREFKPEDESKTLSDLNLVPNAVVLVLTRDQTTRIVRTGGSLVTMLASVMWAMITPAAMAFDYINKMGLQRVVRMVSNLRWKQPTPTNTLQIPGQNQNPGGAGVGSSGAAIRRNMDMFVIPTRSPEPGLPRQQNQPPAQPGAGAAAPPGTPPSIATPLNQQPEASLRQTGGQPQQPQQPQQQQQQFQQRPGGYQAPRYGEANIRRLQDTKKKDDEDKATYNGNSTQQQ